MFTSCCTYANSQAKIQGGTFDYSDYSNSWSLLSQNLFCSRLLLPLPLGPRPFSGRERDGPFWSLRARASLRLPAPSILSCRSLLGPSGGALSLLKLHSGTRSIALRRIQTTSRCFFLGFASACQPVGCPCQSSEALAPLFLYTPFLHTPSYTRMSQRFLSQVQNLKEPPKCH